MVPAGRPALPHQHCSGRYGEDVPRWEGGRTGERKVPVGGGTVDVESSSAESYGMLDFVTQHGDSCVYTRVD